MTQPPGEQPPFPPPYGSPSPGAPAEPQPGHPQQGYSQPGYPQQGYPQPGNPQQGYPQQGYPQPGYPFPPGAYPAPVPPRRSRARTVAVVAAAVVGALVLLGVVGGVVRHVSDNRVLGPARTLAVPEQVAGYRHLTSSSAQGLEQSARSSMTAAAESEAGLFEKALVAVYGTQAGGDRPRLAFVGTNSRDNKPARKLFARGAPGKNAATFMAGAKFRGTQEYAAGPLGGVIRCGTTDAVAGRSVAGCVWFDESTFGFLTAFDGQSPEQLAALTLQLRSLAEH